MRLFDNTQTAFLPFFDEAIVATTKTGESQTLMVSVFDDVEGSTLSESTMDTQRKDILINVPQECWAFVQKLNRGDKVERPFNQTTYKVASVENDFAMGIVIKAKQV